MSFNIKRMAVVSLSYFTLISVLLYFYFYGLPSADNIKQKLYERRAKETHNGTSKSTTRGGLRRTVKNRKAGALPPRRWDTEKQVMVRTTKVYGKKIESHLSSPYFNPFYMQVDNPFPKDLPCDEAPWNIDWYTVRAPDTYALLAPKSCYTTVNFKDVYHLDNVPLDDEIYMGSAKSIPRRVLKLDLASTVDSQPPVWLEVQRWWVLELKMEKVLGFYIPDMAAMSKNSSEEASKIGGPRQETTAEETTDGSEDGFLFVRPEIEEEEQKRYMRWHFWVAPAEDEQEERSNRENAWFYAKPDEDKLFEYMERFNRAYGCYPAYALF